MAALPSILLVDDDYTTNFLNTKLLKHLDPAVEVRTALNGQEALELLHAHCQPLTPGCPALLFLDVNMPVMDGFAFLEAYQHLPEVRQHVTVVMLTTSVNPRDLERLQVLPIAGVLAKPLTLAKVAQVLADYFPSAAAAQ